jgi:hypothetical protein
MSTQSFSSVGHKEHLALYQNPYIFLEMEEMEHEPQKEPTLEQKRDYYKRQQNPQAYYDVFGETDDSSEQNKTPTQPLRHTRPSPAPDASNDEGLVSRERLEKLLDEILGLYKPYVARSDWSRVTEYRSEFLAEASRHSGARQQSIIGQLECLKFPLMPGEKVEYNRAPADRIIGELKRLLA